MIFTKLHFFSTTLLYDQWRSKGGGGPRAALLGGWHSPDQKLIFERSSTALAFRYYFKIKFQSSNFFQPLCLEDLDG